jgi:chemotaxis signal transduction protein
MAWNGLRPSKEEAAVTGQSASLLFELGGKLHAFAAARVHGVIEPPAVAACPFAPAAVEGLVSLGGRIMPLVDLEALLAGGTARPSESAIGQVVELDSGVGRLAVRVGRVLALVPDEALGTSGTVAWQGRAVTRLAAEEIGLGTAATPESPPAEDGDRDGGVIEEAPVSPAPAIARGEAYVVVALGAERYALPVSAVQEIAPAGEIWPMPEAPAAVAGLAYLRGLPLPVVSLAALCALPATRGGALLVLAHEGGRLALLVDAVIGVRRLPARGEGEDGHVDEDGMVVVGLDLGRLLPPEILRRFRSWTASATVSAPLAETRPLVVFVAAGEICALPLDEVDRAVEYRAPAGLPANSGRLTAAIEVGGDVVPVIDLRARLRPGFDAGPPGACLAIRFGGHAYALAIDRLDRLAAVPRADIETVAGEDGPVVGIGRLGGRPLWLLSARRLIEAAA